MIIPVTVKTEGSIVTSAGPDYVVIKLFPRDNNTKIRVFTIEEARAFLEYLKSNMVFQTGEYYFIDLDSETARDQLIQDVEHAIRYLEARK